MNCQRQINRGIVLCIVMLAVLILISYAISAPPKPGIVTDAKVVEVYDGDTVVVEITKRVRVRLLDCWAPEIRGGDLATRLNGQVSKKHLSELVSGRDVILEMPTSGNRHIGESFTFGRVLGHLYLPGDDQTISDKMVKAGMATKEKEK